MHRRVDLLESIDFSEHAPKLRLYLSQVCALAGISKMQLDYWTTKARIRTHGRKQRIYDYDALIFIMLIKQARDKGLSLPAAIEAAREYQATRQDNGNNADRVVQASTEFAAARPVVEQIRDAGLISRLEGSVTSRA